MRALGGVPPRPGAAFHELAEGLPRVDVGKMDFRDGQRRNRADGVVDGDRGVGIGTGIDDDSGALAARLLNPVDQLAFVVGLPENDFQTVRFGALFDRILDIGKRLPAIDFRLAAANQIEVRPVEDVYG